MKIVIFILCLIYSGEGFAQPARQARTKHQATKKQEVPPYRIAPYPLTPIQPAFPELARRLGIEGEIVATALIGKDGRVQRVDILQSTSKLFEKVVTDSIHARTFSPALKADKPIDAWWTDIFVFKLTTEDTLRRLREMPQKRTQTPELLDR